MTEKKQYVTADIELLMFSQNDVIATSADISLGNGAWDNNGWT